METKNNIKAAVIGCGSIGRRHAENLKNLGVKDLVFFDSDTALSQSMAERTGGKAFKSLDRILDNGPSIVFITSPTSFHLDIALEAAQRDMDLFIEKPLSHNFNRVNDLIALVKQKGLITMIGCNMRFHPGPSRVKLLLKERAIGRILFSHFYTGSFMPEWRKDRNYRESYSAEAGMGGGCILDCIHEIDLAHWCAGDIKEVTCIADNAGFLGINAEEIAAIICRHNSGEISEIHMDYIQQTYNRGCQIVGEAGSIFWNFNEKTVRWYDANVKKWKIYWEPEGWEINRMYMDEIEYFFDCLKHRRETMNPVSEGAKVLRVALAAKKSSAEGRKKCLKGALD